MQVYIGALSFHARDCARAREGKLAQLCSMVVSTSLSNNQQSASNGVACVGAQPVAFWSSSMRVLWIGMAEGLL